MPAKLHLLDADVLIHSNRNKYPLKEHHPFWKWLLEQQGKLHICSIAPVKEELEVYDDELARWATSNPGFFIELDKADQFWQDKVANSLRKDPNKYTRSAIANFLVGADAWLIAHALKLQRQSPDVSGHKSAVVTNENSRHKVSRIKIPVVCEAFGIECMNGAEMLEDDVLSFPYE